MVSWRDFVIDLRGKIKSPFNFYENKKKRKYRNLFFKSNKENINNES